jgi:hypothetical protein
MRAKEFIREEASAGASCAGNVAVFAQPMGEVITRTQNTKPAKYANSAPVAQRKKQNVIR